jgi:PhzF family phenazine biosynthesis protein
MKHIELYWVDAFSDKPFYGNSAAVIIDADDLPDEEKQEIAKGLNLSESVFISKSEVADFKVQFFTPKQETALCGHGTIAAFKVLSSIGRIKRNLYENVVSVRQEAKAGILPIEISFDSDGLSENIMMYQTLPDFWDKNIDKNEVADILGVSLDNFESTYPLKIVSTGRSKLFIPIINRGILDSIKPDFNRMVKYCIEESITGFHLFTFDTHFSDSITTARHFAPSAGVNEDPVTGIAAGALGCYLSEFGSDNNSSLTFRMEQGFNMGRNGIINVEINKEDKQYKSVKVGGKARILFNAEMRL